MRRGLSLKTLAIGIVGLLLVGLLLDAFNGFFILRNVKSATWGVGGLILFALIYLLGEAGAEWITSKDKVSHPLHKRVFHLSLLLGFASALGFTCWFVFKKLG
jgi:hypothetical protein